jgi:hypothetical protein
MQGINEVLSKRFEPLVGMFAKYKYCFIMTLLFFHYLSQHPYYISKNETNAHNDCVLEYFAVSYEPIENTQEKEL